MKKTATKASASTKSATAAKASPAKKPAAAVPKIKKTAPAIKAAPAVKKTPAAKKSPAKVTAASPESRTTTIVAAIDVGFGNSLTLRGEGAGLSWEKGVAMECVSGDVWSISLAETALPIVCKFLINDEVWCTGDDYTVLPGSSVVLSPTF